MGLIKKETNGQEVTFKIEQSVVDKATDTLWTAGGVSLGVIVAAFVLRLFGGK